MDASATTGPVLITVKDSTSPGTFTPSQLFTLIWSLRYQALYHYNRSPWVERGYATAVADVQPDEGQQGAWIIELLDASDQEGALGYHEDKAFSLSSPKGLPRKASNRSSRGLAASTQLPLAKVFAKTSRTDGVSPSEVASHEMIEMLVDPFVVAEGEVRTAVDPATGETYIVEACDAVQGRGYQVGAPEHRGGSASEAIVADFCYPSWWKLAQTRPFTSLAAEFKLAPNLRPFTLAPQGYISVERKPGEWTQIYGSDKPATAI